MLLQACHVQRVNAIPIGMLIALATFSTGITQRKILFHLLESDPTNRLLRSSCTTISSAIWHVALNDKQAYSFRRLAFLISSWITMHAIGLMSPLLEVTTCPQHTPSLTFFGQIHTIAHPFGKVFLHWSDIPQASICQLFKLSATAISPIQGNMLSLPMVTVFYCNSTITKGLTLRKKCQP